MTLDVCRKTAQNISSMLQDVNNKRFTEIDSINGAIVTAGNKLGLPTPVNAELVEKVKEIEQNY
jgi:2-dehydropantoate 2-reductase